MTQMATPRNAQLGKEPEGQLITFLVFQLSGTHYAVSVTDVREIITNVEVSAVPGSPSYLSGVANLRGRVLPIIDLKKKFCFDATSANTRECFIVLTTPSEEGPLEFAIRVDTVHEVVKLHEQQIDMAPAMTSFANHLVFDGVAHTPQGVRMILDTKSLVTQLQQDIRSIHSSGMARSNYPIDSEFETEA